MKTPFIAKNNKTNGSVSGVILCGGKSSRMGYVNKCFLKINNKTFIEIIIDKLKNIFDEIILVTKTKEEYLFLQREKIYVVQDIFNEHSSLTGIHAGLLHAKNNYSFITGCDTPLINKKIIELLISEIEDKIDIIVPRIGKYIEPLCAIYSKRCIPVIEQMLQKKCFQIKRFYEYMKVKKIDEKRLREYDPRLYSFLNINTPKDYEEVLKINLNII